MKEEETIQGEVVPDDGEDSFPGPPASETVKALVNGWARTPRHALLRRSTSVPSRPELDERMARMGIELVWSRYAEDGSLRLFRKGSMLSDETAGYADREVTVKILVRRGRGTFLAVLPTTREALDRPGSLEFLASVALSMAEGA